MQRPSHFSEVVVRIPFSPIFKIFLRVVQVLPDREPEVSVSAPKELPRHRVASNLFNIFSLEVV